MNYNGGQRQNQMSKLAQTHEDGLLETVFLIRGDVPGCREPRYGHLLEADINDTYSVAVKLMPNGLSEVAGNPMAMLIAINSKNATKIYARFECALLTLNGSRRYQYLMSDMHVFEFECFRSAKPIGVAEEVLKQLDVFQNGDGLVYELIVSIDTRRQVSEPRSSFPTKLVEKLTERFHDPTFGDTGFIVGGVKLYGHKELLVKNSRVFRGTLKYTRKPGLYYMFSDVYPQVFVKHMIQSYLTEQKFCKKCFRYRTKSEKKEQVENNGKALATKEDSAHLQYFYSWFVVPK